MANRYAQMREQGLEQSAAAPVNEQPEPSNRYSQMRQQQAADEGTSLNLGSNKANVTAEQSWLNRTLDRVGSTAGSVTSALMGDANQTQVGGVDQQYIDAFGATDGGSPAERVQPLDAAPGTGSGPAQTARTRHYPRAQALAGRLMSAYIPPQLRDLVRRRARQRCESLNGKASSRLRCQATSPWHAPGAASCRGRCQGR